MTKQSDATDIGILLGWAARPREIPARNDEYHRLILRYRNEPDFARLAEAVFLGAGLHLSVDERVGAIAAASPDSPLRLTMGDFMKRANLAQRSVVGAVILAVASTAYPDTSMLEDPDRMATFTVRSVVDLLDRVADAHARDTDPDGSADDDLVEAWRFWNQLNPDRHDKKRASLKDRYGVVIKVCNTLTEAGYLTDRGDLEGGTWTSRPRFRHAVISLTEDSELFSIVNGLAHSQSGEQL
jgi:hypothetical protein